MSVPVYVVYGLGIGCHKEAIHAYERAGAKVELVHIRQLLTGDKNPLDARVVNLSGGFLHGDMGGAGMYAANEAEQISDSEGLHLKEKLLELARRGGVVYGQCNGFQLLVRLGLLPGIDGKYDEQTVSLAGNDGGVYRMDFVKHQLARPHFAFDGVDPDDLYLWCRHGEGKLVFSSPFGLVTPVEADRNRRAVNRKHVILRYDDYPHNGSVDMIAGLVDPTGNIIGHMAHTEGGIYLSRHPDFFRMKDAWRRLGVRTAYLTPERLEGEPMKVFRNIVEHVR